MVVLLSDAVAIVKGATAEFGVSIFDEFVRELDGVLRPVTAGVDHWSRRNCRP